MKWHDAGLALALFALHLFVQVLQLACIWWSTRVTQEVERVAR